MTATEERAALKAVAKEVAEELRKFTGTVLTYRKRIDVVINHLLSDADKLALEAADEVGDAPTTKKLGYGATETATADKVEKFVEEDDNEPPTPLGKGKRACSICRKPGHRAKNCPEQNKADLAEAVKKRIAKKKAKKEKK